MSAGYDTEALLNDLCDLALSAGEVTLKYFQKDDLQVTRKDDSSPVTQADQEAEEVICARLKVLTPDVPVVGEESVAAGYIPDIHQRFWVVDPVDGTKEFISGRGDFTVNIGLVEKGIPILGVVYAPAKNELYWGAQGYGAFRQIAGGAIEEITVREAPADGITVVASRSHGTGEKLDAYLSQFRVKDRKSRGSSLKICMIACGDADLYPRFGPTCEWDTGAADAVLRAAGGIVVDADSGQALLYGKVGFKNGEFIARASVSE